MATPLVAGPLRLDYDSGDIRCVLETVEVRADARRQGVFSRFLDTLVAIPGIDLFVVEAVQNPVLGAALLRRGWDCDPEVMDFYHFPAKPERICRSINGHFAMRQIREQRLASFALRGKFLDEILRNSTMGPQHGQTCTKFSSFLHQPTS